MESGVSEMSVGCLSNPLTLTIFCSAITSESKLMFPLGSASVLLLRAAGTLVTLGFLHCLRSNR